MRRLFAKQADRPGGGIALNLLVILFIVALVGLGLRSLITQDSRFGWGMFSHRTDYAIAYKWLYKDGSTTRVVDTRKDLQGRQSIISGSRHHSTRYGIGAMRRWVSSYLAYLYERRRPPDAVGVRAEVTYLIDGKEDPSGISRSEVLNYPSSQDP